jgi:serine-type D-Ala-D-Ala carboxypeptidase/endopeptidase
VGAMHKKYLFTLVVTLLSLTFSVGVAHAADCPPQLELLLREKIDLSKPGVSIVVGSVDASGIRTNTCGSAIDGHGQPTDGETVFQIGSVTKAFTSLLLADMVNRGEVKLDDPISKYLPKSVRTPTVNGQEVTLLQLARHTSGLPRLPDGFSPKDPNNPYADFTVEKLYEFLNRYRTSRSIGKNYEYSNLGFRLLGHTLERRAGASYGELLTSRVLQPLALKSTGVSLSSDMKKRLTTGHDNTGVPVPSWSFIALHGSGAMYSTANDLLAFAQAYLELRDTPLKEAMRMTHAPTTDKFSPELDVGLGWDRIRVIGDSRIASKDGMVPGYVAYFGLDFAKRKGVVVLSNVEVDITDIGASLILDSTPTKSKVPQK